MDQNIRWWKKNSEITQNAIFLSVAFAVNIVWILVLSKFFTPGFSMADDLFIRDMLNHVTYDSSGYSIYIKHSLGWVLSYLYRVAPHIEWYAWLLFGLNGGSLIIIHYAFQKSGKNVWGWLLANILHVLLLSTYTKQLMYPTYTEVAGLCGIAAIALFCVTDTNDKVPRYWEVGQWIVICLLAGMSFALREDAFFELVPYAALAFVWKICRISTKRKNCLILGGCIALSVGMVFLEDKIAYTAEGYEQVYTDIEVQTQSVDYYGIPSWWDHEAFYTGIGVEMEDALFLYQSSYAMAEVDREQFSEITKYSEEIAGASEVSLEKLTATWGKMKSVFLNHESKARQVLWYSVWGLIVLGCMCVILRKEWIQLMIPIATVAIYMGLAWYLCSKGRIPDRVVVILLTGFVCMEASWLIGVLSETKKQTIAVMILIALLGAVLPKFKENTLSATKAYSKTFEIMAEAEALREKYIAEHPENYFFISPYAWGTGGYAFVNSTERMNNYSYIHGYMTYLPEHAEKLTFHGYGEQRMLEHFIHAPEVLLMPTYDSVEFIIGKYLEKHYPEKELYLIEKVGGFPVYNVRDKEAIQ